MSTTYTVYKGLFIQMTYVCITLFFIRTSTFAVEAETKVDVFIFFYVLSLKRS